MIAIATVSSLERLFTSVCYSVLILYVCGSANATSKGSRLPLTTTVAETEMEPFTVPHETESPSSFSYPKQKDTMATEPAARFDSLGSPADGHPRGRDCRSSRLVLFLASFAVFFVFSCGLNQIPEGSQSARYPLVAFVANLGIVCYLFRRRE
jgi:hypothetical protein